MKSLSSVVDRLITVGLENSPDLVEYVGGPCWCDVCGHDLSSVFYDVSVPPQGQWGNLCRPCFNSRGLTEAKNLGVGKGQKYMEVKTASKVHWIKVGG